MLADGSSNVNQTPESRRWPASAHPTSAPLRISDTEIATVGNATALRSVNVGRIGPGSRDTDALNVVESYSLTMIRGDRRFGHRLPVTNAGAGQTRLIKPVDRIGDKSIR